MVAQELYIEFVHINHVPGQWSDFPFYYVDSNITYSIQLYVHAHGPRAEDSTVGWTWSWSCAVQLLTLALTLTLTVTLAVVYVTGSASVTASDCISHQTISQCLSVVSVRQ